MNLPTNQFFSLITKVLFSPIPKFWFFQLHNKLKRDLLSSKKSLYKIKKNELRKTNKCSNFENKLALFVKQIFFDQKFNEKLKKNNKITLRLSKKKKVWISKALEKYEKTEDLLVTKRPNPRPNAIEF